MGWTGGFGLEVVMLFLLLLMLVFLPFSVSVDR